MKIPPFWAKERYEGTDAKGRPCATIASGWSFTSLLDAKSEAGKRARRAFEYVAFGRREKADYYNIPMREEVLKTIAEGGETVAILTRNRYGALVLNSARVLFADVDLPEEAQSPGFLASLLDLFSPKRREERKWAGIMERIKHIDAWAQKNPSRSFRLYRTAEGLRLLFTDRLYDPVSEETTALLRDLGSDPMYMKLTKRQECFRARLSAKPWRCGCDRPPASFPFEDSKADQAFRDWLRLYEAKESGFRVCELVKEFGRSANHAAIKTIVDLHDRQVGLRSNAPLA